MEPILLFWQITVPGLAILIPYTLLPVVVHVTKMEPVPVVAPMVFPVTVPAFTSPWVIFIPIHEPFVELVQSKLLMVLFWILFAVPVPAFK